MVHATAALIRYPQARDDLTQDEVAIVEELPERLKTFSRGEDIVQTHQEVSQSIILVEGIVGRVVYSAEGKRKITALHLSGEFIDLHGFLIKTLDHGLQALTACKVAYVPHARLHDKLSGSPHLTRLFWLSTAIDAAIQRAFNACLGMMEAHARVAHVLCDLKLRSDVAGVSRGQSFPLPLTQQELADIVGVSTVHINRSVQILRREKLIAWKGGTVIVIDFDGLAALCNFDPTYLSLVKRPR